VSEDAVRGFVNNGDMPLVPDGDLRVGVRFGDSARNGDCSTATSGIPADCLPSALVSESSNVFQVGIFELEDIV